MGSGMVARAAVLDSLAARATSHCPASNVTECDLQSLRRASGGTNGMCLGECTDTVEMGNTAACLTPSEYPPEDVRRANGVGPHQQAAVIHSDVWVRELRCQPESVFFLFNPDSATKISTFGRYVQHNNYVNNNNDDFKRSSR